jgi:defect-in-organelle-trafficking protein DotC
MKKTNNMKKIVIATISFLASNVVLAQSYGGLSYPLPEVLNKKEQKVVELNEIMSSSLVDKKNGPKEEVTEMRKQALVELAQSLGASAGMVKQMQILKKDMDKYSTELDRIFDFSKLIIDNGVLAPVLIEGLANYAQNSDDEIRVADKIYKIDVPAKFVSVYPTWRSYVMFSYPSTDIPPNSYLPKNETEQQIWDMAVQEGWKEGIQQANRIFEVSYSRLEKDYLGMIKYKLLLGQGLITPTIIAKQNLGVTGGGKEMAINDQVFRITDHSSLNPNSKEWRVEYPVTNNTAGKLK